MSGGKVAAIVVAIVVVAVGAAIGAGWWWLRAHKDELQRTGKESFRDGAHYGIGKDANACVVEAERRLRHVGSSPVSSSVSSVSFDGILGEAANKVFLEGCLKASTMPPSFCDGVPKRDDMTASVRWLSTKCATLGDAREPCTRLLGAVQERCEAPR